MKIEISMADKVELEYNHKHYFSVFSKIKITALKCKIWNNLLLSWYT